MFKIAALPQITGRRPTLVPAPATATNTADAVSSRRRSSADIRIRRFEQSGVSEDSYTAILPPTNTPIDLMRAIIEACKDSPEFQIQGAEDEHFIMTLTLKA